MLRCLVRTWLLLHSLSSVSPRVQTSDELQRALQEAVAREDFAEAARLRDVLRFRRSDALQGVEAANARFYAAFERMDAREMARVWGEGDHVRCTHPGASCILGRQEVCACPCHAACGGCVGSPHCVAISQTS